MSLLAPIAIDLSLLSTHRLHDGTLCTLVQSIELGHVFIVKCEVINLGVVNDARRCVALRQRHISLLQTPAHKDLIGTFVMFLADADQCRILRLLVANKRAVGFDDDVVLLAVLHNFALLAPGVQLWLVSYLHSIIVAAGTHLDLVHNWRPDFAKRLDLLNVLNTIVAHTNVPHLAFILRLLLCLPHELPFL